MIYLASPYSHPDAAMRKLRFDAACRAAAALLRVGETVFAPVVYCHALVAHGLPVGWTFWESFDRNMLERCDEVAVLTLDRWRDRAGVQAEVRIARELGKPIRHVASPFGESPTLAHVGAEVPG